ncbi:hypothetical protein [Paraburkholderia saeva]|jgi:hypothetical protein|uniref:hypothetical protein n=1 Tax=Paraburkholderia saeva TaxID=2777537 RepID=UPI001DD15960|nr:hypothetical protein [Paraburkholderia saeva]CAG4918015.1 hypothetical protein R70241_04601 [Paraburkholderia saeva]
MKTIFAALASALLVSTAFAQTAAPASAPAGNEAHLKASTAGGLKADTTADSKTSGAAPSAHHASGTKTHAKIAHKKPSPDAKVAKTTGGSDKTADATQAKADNKAETTKTQ